MMTLPLKFNYKIVSPFSKALFNRFYKANKKSFFVALTAKSNNESLWNKIIQRIKETGEVKGAVYAQQVKERTPKSLKWRYGHIPVTRKQLCRVYNQCNQSDVNHKGCVRSHGNFSCCYSSAGIMCHSVFVNDCCHLLQHRQTMMGIFTDFCPDVNFLHPVNALSGCSY